jgi:hypothetical protein
LLLLIERIILFWIPRICSQPDHFHFKCVHTKVNLHLTLVTRSDSSIPHKLALPGHSSRVFVVPVLASQLTSD